MFMNGCQIVNINIKTWDSAADQIEDLKDKKEDLFFTQTTRPGVKHVGSTTKKPN